MLRSVGPLCCAAVSDHSVVLQLVRPFCCAAVSDHSVVLQLARPFCCAAVSEEAWVVFVPEFFIDAFQQQVCFVSLADQLATGPLFSTLLLRLSAYLF